MEKWPTSFSEARAPIDRAELHKILDRLLDLRDRTNLETCTDPGAVPLHPDQDAGDPAKGKYICALAAAYQAKSLYIAAAGWAINQIVGSVLSGEETDSNSHDCEAAGSDMAQFGYSLADEDPTTARSIVCELLKEMPIPDSLGFALRDSLSALNVGEVMLLAKPSAKGKHGKPYTLAGLRLRAVEHANYLYGKGYKLKSAHEIVASAFCVSPDNLKTWTSRLLPEIFGRKHVSDAIGRARDAGKAFSRHPIGAGFDAVDAIQLLSNEGFSLTIARIFERESIIDIGKEYNEALRK